MAQFAENDEINKLLNSILTEVREFTEKQHEHIKNLNEIGTALSAENNLDKLLEMILTQAKKFTNADGGTLYLRSYDERELRFTVVETESLNIKMGGTMGQITWPPLQLYKPDGEQNRQMVAAMCALDGNLINIEDVYFADGFNFEGTKKFDASTGYRSKSMLVIPMRNYENEIIGVLQLINRQDNESGEVIAFSKEDESNTMSLASQAAVAITNTRLVKDLESLLESFIKTIAVAIDEKSPYTGGHVRRVAEITMLIAETINSDKDGVYKDIFYNQDQLKELYFAAWMHDVGKITTPEFIVDKATKLETIFDRIGSVRERFEILKRDYEIEFLKSKMELLQNKIMSKDEKIEKLKELTSNLETNIKTLDEEFAFIEQSNIGGEFMSDDKIERIKTIAKRQITINGEFKDLLSGDEIMNLSIRRGTLTDSERQKINDHATMSLKMLQSLPFPKKLRKVPEIAGAHHEKLNGKGYPQGLSADKIPLEGRILALADIFEALTAADRPYKKAKTLSEVKKILSFMIKDYEIDENLLKFFYENRLHLLYATKELKSEQIDIES